MIATLLLGLLPAAQNPKDLAKNDGRNCPWCHGQPELMRAAGIASHGGFDFGATDTARVDQLLGGLDLYWIESQHFEIGLALSTYKIATEEAKKIRAELTELADWMPDIDPKTRFLDPWLRTHLYALRTEKVWRRFLEVMQVHESDFPDGNSTWVLGTPYFGEGPYVGEKGKFELLVVPTGAHQVSFLRTHFGLFQTTTQRWNVIDRDSLIVVTNLAENELRGDEQLHGHVAFNLAINLLDAYRHYSYETPCWLREGLGHSMEREINPRFNTFDFSEGSVGVKINKENWDSEVKTLVQSGKAPRVAELTALKTYAEFKLPDHYTCWSMTRFLIETNPGGYGCLNARLHGLKNDQGYPDGSNLTDHQRDAFRDCLGLSYPEFDSAWQAWALTRGTPAPAR